MIVDRNTEILSQVSWDGSPSIEQLVAFSRRRLVRLKRCSLSVLSSDYYPIFFALSSDFSISKGVIRT